MAHPMVRLVVPVVVGVAAGVGAIAAQTVLLRRGPRQPAIPAAEPPLRFHGWWNSDASSPMAYAHPGVLFVDGTSGTIIDSWDRRTRRRVSNPRLVGSEHLMADAIVVVDATTGDVLHTLPTAGMARG